MKTKKLIKRALKSPELYTEAELQYLTLVRLERKKQKQKKKTLETDPTSADCSLTPTENGTTTAK
ncbi:MAG: hypothetical protein GY880_32645 [Planctomycetaceae bacterium]|nr:hypothetical protein [Planctomycetaceae bacterium]